MKRQVTILVRLTVFVLGWGMRLGLDKALLQADHPTTNNPGQETPEVFRWHGSIAPGGGQCRQCDR